MRSLPIVTPSRRRLPLAAEARTEDRAARPLYAVWEVTLRCDLACRHCSSRAGRARADELTTEEALRLVDDLADLSVLEITLIGGEVYLRPDWPEIVRAIRRRGMECTIVTGGRAFTPDLARAAKDAGLTGASISIDGLAVSHDALRGWSGSHAAALAAMAGLAREGIPVSANTQVGRPNRRDLPALFDSIANAGAHSWQVQLTVAGGRVVDNPEILLEPYHLIDTMPVLARLADRGRRVGVRLWPGNNLGYYGPFESVLRGDLPGGRKGSCGAGRGTIGIESNGDVKGCPSLPSSSYVGGNVREAPLRDIWERAPALRFTRDDRRSELWGHCASCYYAEDCLGGCSWTAHCLFGRRGNNPFCHHRALELLRVGRRERVVLVDRGERRSFEHGRFDLVEEDWPAGELARARRITDGAEEWLDG